MAGGAESIEKGNTFPNLPEDIICEILRHCTGLNWSYRELALLCTINREWSRLAKRTLYKDLRLDYRREVDALAVSLTNSPQTAELVHSIVINGDGAHGPNIYRLLKQARQTRHILFFDFDLGSSLEERALCAAVPLHNLTSLSFSVMPASFVDKAVRECGERITSLRIYRVSLAAVDPQLRGKEKPRWHLPNLRYLSLQHVGDMSHSTFQELIASTSARLHVLKIHYERPHDICRDTSIWQGCNFTCLERLELGSFASDVVSTILWNNGTPLSCLHTLKLPSLRTRMSSSISATESSPPSSSSIAYIRPPSNVLYNLPSSLQILELQACQDLAVYTELPDRLDKHKLWLPKLRKCPTLTLGENVLQDGDVAILRIAYFAAARKSGLRLPEGSQYYALKGYY